MKEDIEEHQTTILTASDSSTDSLPPLEVSPLELIHESASLCTTVLDSMKQAVPIDAKASTVGTKQTGLFYMGEDSIGGGETLFSTSPLVMAWKPEAAQMPDSEDVSKQNDTLTESKVCDFCFKNPRTFTEDVYKNSGGTLHALSPARRCTGCNTCHQKAWKQFHRFECGILKTFQRRDPTPLMHLRVLLMNKAELIPRNVMLVNRREALRQQFLNDEYVCKCKVCEVELHALHRLVAGDPSQAMAVKMFYGDVIVKALQLIQDIRNAVWDKRKKELIHKLVALAEGKFVAHLGRNPMDSLYNKLIPWLHMTGAASFLEIRELEEALHYAILSNMLYEPSFDQTSITNLRTLINTLRAICELPDSEKRLKKFSASRGSRFPTIQDLRALTVSCMIILCLLAHKVYGPRIGFVRALLRWSRSGEKLCAPLKPCTSDFNAATERAQNLLRSWCLGVRTVPFYPVNAPTRAQYKDFKKMLHAREEKGQQESQARLA
ncbi:hypothetical protein SEPCBS57363_001825 [Sporothrix epigloea]|uniref:MYND-type zinc finger protein samB n=1 Tax=Sporothrix epigloea TaxID=1892477 RepID=A0ABP0DCE2_9PEZI